jgi:hypothetical protein
MFTRIASVLATTASSEESFSLLVGGLIVREPQISLNSESVYCILFLRHNMK